MSYQDPDNVHELIETFLQLKNAKESYDFINHHLPDWMVHITNDYSNDYVYLRKNWYNMCQQLQVEPQAIILVKYLPGIGQNIMRHKLITTICEKMTINGFLIRPADDFILCPHCQAVLCAEHTWRLLRERNFDVPEEWSQECQSVCLQHPN